MDTGKIAVISATGVATIGITAFVVGAIVGIGAYILISERKQKWYTPIRRKFEEIFSDVGECD